ncbi:hypothetical protein D3C73_1259850 [compost metagenome]
MQYLQTLLTIIDPQAIEQRQAQHRRHQRSLDQQDQGEPAEQRRRPERPGEHPYIDQPGDQQPGDQAVTDAAETQQHHADRMRLGFSQYHHQQHQAAEPGSHADQVNELIEDQQLACGAIEHGAVADRGQGGQQQAAEDQTQRKAGA